MLGVGWGDIARGIHDSLCVWGQVGTSVDFFFFFFAHEGVW